MTLAAFTGNPRSGCGGEIHSISRAVACSRQASRVFLLPARSSILACRLLADRPSSCAAAALRQGQGASRGTGRAARSGGGGPAWRRQPCMAGGAGGEDGQGHATAGKAVDGAPGGGAAEGPILQRKATTSSSVSTAALDAASSRWRKSQSTLRPPSL
mmetsp:Transcript_70092/g.186748  ORF Transcript_70092/g.186748 Transcript_70092/m.186748 type:complete len:158 (+) Transcript_70092:166-639(+)